MMTNQRKPPKKKGTKGKQEKLNKVSHMQSEQAGEHSKLGIGASCGIPQSVMFSCIMCDGARAFSSLLTLPVSCQHKQC